MVFVPAGLIRHVLRLGIWTPEVRRPSLPPVALWKLPPEDVGDDDARVCTDTFNFIPAIIDHEEYGSYPWNRVSTGAIGIHFVCPCFGPRDYIAVYAQACSARNTAVSVEDIRTHTGERADGRNESGANVGEGAP